MRRHIGLRVLVLVNMLYAGSVHAESVYYVQSSSAKVVSEPSFSAKVIAVIGLGEQLTSTGREGSWVKVTLHSQPGYVHSLLLSAHPPLRKAEVINAKEPDINNGVRRRSSNLVSAAASRGLTKEDRSRLDTEDRVDFVAVKKMESLVISQSEIDNFTGGDK